MALSGREIMLVLRARDEASRTLRRVSRSMDHMQRSRIAANNENISAQSGALRTLSRDIQDVGYAYNRAALENTRLRMEGKKSQKEYQRSMLLARQDRMESLRAIQIRQREAADSIRASQEQINQAHAVRQAERERGYALMDSGAAVTTLGVAMTGIGVVGVRAMANTVQASIAYRQEAARTLTQVDQVGVGLKRISNIGREVGRTVPVAFEEIQPALYDIFSSIDVGTKGARKLLHQFARDAVGGQAEMETATRANLAIMNAYNLKVADVAEVSDFMFQLVRKGVGTYDEFAKVIGYSIPSAVRAGVTYKQLGGMLAFMTRNGLSAARASTSAARALDALSNPKTVTNLKKMGIAVTDASGEFKPLPKILDLMMSKMSDMNNFQKSQFLKKAFLGSGGTIQAMRFFNMVFKNMDEYKQRTREMNNSSGAAGKAFETMAKTPQAQLTQLNNNFKDLRIEIGDVLLPIIGTLAGWLNRLMDSWNSLSPQVRKTVVIIAAVTAVMLVVIGVITTLVGLFMMLMGVLALVEVSLGFIVAVSAAVVAGFVLLGAAAFLIYKNWSKISPLFDQVRAAIMDKLGSALDWFSSTFGPGINEVIASVKDGWSQFTQALNDAWDIFMSHIDVDGMKTMWSAVKGAWTDVVAAFVAAKPQLVDLGKFIGSVLVVAFQFLGSVIKMLADVAGPIFNNLLKIVIRTFQGIGEVVSGSVQYLQGVIQFWKGLFTGDWREMWTGIKNMTKGAWKVITAIFKWASDIVTLAVKGLVEAIWNFFKWLWHELVGGSIVPDLINAIVGWFKKLPGLVGAYVSAMVKAVIRFFENMANRVKDLARTVAGVWGNIIKPALSALARFIGNNVVNAFSRAISAIERIWNKLKSIVAVPVNFAIRVYNEGVVPLVNSAYKFFGGKGSAIGTVGYVGEGAARASSDLQRASTGGGRFALGGAVPGTGNRDTVHAILTPGEFVITKRRVRELESRAPGVLHRLNSGKLRKRTKNRMGDLDYLLGGDRGYKTGGLVATSISRAQNFAKSQQGKPYVWGGVGPGGYDCSGFQSAITNVLRGITPYRRLGSTATMPWAGFQPGLGQYSVGWFKGSPGHTAGNIGGLNAESRGGDGVVTGTAARGPTNTLFNGIAHLGIGGGGFLGTGGEVRGLSEVKGWIKDLINMMAKAKANITGSPWGKVAASALGKPMTGAVEWLKKQVGGTVKKALPLLSPAAWAASKIFDSGGVLEPGGVAVNMSRRPEAVLTEDQMATAFARGGPVRRNRRWRRRMDRATPNIIGKLTLVVGTKGLKKALRNSDVREVGRWIRGEFTRGLRQPDPKAVADVTGDFGKMIDKWAAGAAGKLVDKRKQIDSKLKSLHNSLRFSNLTPKTRRRYRGFIDELEKERRGINKKIGPFMKSIRLLKKRLRDEFKDMKNLAERREKIADRLAKARERLNNAIQAKADYRRAVAESVRDFGSLSSVGEQTDIFGNELPTNIRSINIGLAGKLAAIRKWRANLKKMLAMGFSKNIYNQVVQMGPEAGGEYAAALVAATPGQVRQTNALTAAINSEATNIANTTSANMYNAGIKAAQGLVNGLKAKQAELAKVATRLGNIISRAIRKALRMRSPSKVGWLIGANFGQSIADAMHARRRDVSKASRALARAATVTAQRSSISVDDTFPRSPRPPGGPGGGPVGGGPGGPGGQAPYVHQEVTINTQEIDPRKHAAELGWALAEGYRI